jgi:hypothetical protein
MKLAQTEAASPFVTILSSIDCAGDLLRAATRAGVSMTVTGDRLLLEAAAKPPAAILDAIKRHKAEIITLLTAAEASSLTRLRGSTAPAAPATPDTNGAKHGDTGWKKRAAVAEYDGGIPRRWAETQARLTARPPVDVSQRQWDQLRNDFGRFLDRWAHDADVLGWRPADLLGWDPAHLYTPIAKHVGLIWKFDGATAVELTRDAITTTRGIFRKRLLQ